MLYVLPILALAGVATGQAVSAYGQCGGIGYKGSTTCVTGYICVYSNPYYSQCLPGKATSTLTSITKSTSSSKTISSSKTTSSSTTTSASKYTSTMKVVSPSTTTLITKTSSSAASSPTGSLSTVRYLGRVNPATKELTWPGTGVSFTFTGTMASIGIASISGTNSADLVIDGGAPIIIANVDGPVISTPSALAYGTHTVSLRKRSETDFGSIFLGNITTDGTLIATPAPARLIELIGDSITVGYGLDGVYPCTNTAALEDNQLTDGVLAAQSLGADYSVVAWSGKGIVRNYESTPPDDSLLVPELWTRYGANDADNSYTFPTDRIPQAVVINLGTNDFGYLGVRDELNVTLYTNAMVQFVKTIQTHYPNAQFFLQSSPLLGDSYPTVADAQHTTESNALKAAVAQIGSTAHFVDWPSQGSNVGCDYHPSAATNAAEAPVLAAAISSVLSW